jgi:hypothetical protein
VSDNILDIPPSVVSARSLWDLQRRQENDPNELIRHNFLNVGGSVLIVAPTGVGKSVFETQCAIAFGAGIATLGLEPTRPLKSLIIQAEDDDNDRAEMRDGVIEGLNLTPSQIVLARDNVLIQHDTTHTGEGFFIDVVDPLLEAHKPDLLWINPLFAYLGGDVKDQALVSMFLRNWLNPRLIKHKCGSLTTHHTNKPSKDRTEWNAGDFAYLGSGSNELANWPRAILAIRSIGSHDVFSLDIGKRGKRLQWKDAEGKPTMQRLIGHSNRAGFVFWRGVDESEIAKPTVTTDAIMGLVPREGRIERSRLQVTAQAKGLGRDKVRFLIDDMLEAKQLFESKEKRNGGGRDRIFVSRYRHEDQ